MTKIAFADVRRIPIDAVLAHYGVETRKRNNTCLEISPTIATRSR